MSIQKGGCVSTIALLKSRTPSHATPTPRAPPASDSRKVSERNCRTTRKRLAPSAVRIATSLLRTVARARSRLATLAQAMRSTRKTAASMVYSRAVGSSPMYSLVYGLMTKPTPLFVSGYSCARRRAMVANSAAARSERTPASSRP